jgi:hypothetical protein
MNPTEPNETTTTTEVATSTTTNEPKTKKPARKPSAAKKVTPKKAPSAKKPAETPAEPLAQAAPQEMTRGQNSKLVRSYTKFGNKNPSGASILKLWTELTDGGINIMRSRSSQIAAYMKGELDLKQLKESEKPEKK